MRRALIIAIATVAAIAVSACGSSTPKAVKRPAATTSTPPVTYADGMTAEEMAHMTGNQKPLGVPEPLAVLADGTFDPAKIDLGGVSGVTATEQKNAEKLLRETIEVLPHWASTDTAAAEGFHSIGDGLTGDEHWIHWDWIDDNTWLNPHKPESLVYHVDRSTGTRTLEAVMFLLPKIFDFNNLPDVGGRLVQFHIHDNLCFTDTMPAPRVAGLTFDGKCSPPLVKFHPNVMMHVWIRPNPCGPFAALEGIGAGQVKPGDTKACDEMHGAGL